MKETLPPLSAEQQAIVAKINQGRSVLVTGPAGTGKSRILKELSLGEKPIPVCASTGIAAVQVGGLTLHSWAGIGLAEEPAKVLAETLLERRGPALQRIKSCKRLAIDEVSMLSAALFTKLDEVFRIIRKNNQPFGGVQLVLFGDFLQLPPVSRDGSAEFAFHSPAWAEANIGTGLLTHIWRQEDRVFSGALNRVRVGDSAGEVGELLHSRFKAKDLNPEVRPVIVYSHNADVDRENEQWLNRLVGKVEEYEASDSGLAGPLAALQKHCLAPEVLRLRKGAQVMLLQNVSPEEGMANGSIGVVEDFHKINRMPIIRFQNGERWTADRFKWETKVGGEVAACRRQLPLRLAWAITAHKSQGMTLDKIQVHLHRVFEYGQAYVALSRARSLPGLFIQSIKDGCIKAHPDAVQFYENASL